ncbi:hypothetical protein BsIDN1_52540 [Bacillus safensis]|uniref:Malic enzyme NAD-binding domain-containing protein n=1 Tax=Bacillus safensis TaxID=561879 RepID=A0A5S9MJ46_BACIA|nr:hypothetical protein BsIDN1_52540 [Bacillus safensis]
MTDSMFVASAEAIASMVNVGKPGAAMLPSVDQLRTVSATVAVRVAQAAIDEGIAEETPDDLIQAVQDAMWHPVYKKNQSHIKKSFARIRLCEAFLIKQQNQ